MLCVCWLEGKEKIEIVGKKRTLIRLLPRWEKEEGEQDACLILRL